MKNLLKFLIVSLVFVFAVSIAQSFPSLKGIADSALDKASRKVDKAVDKKIDEQVNSIFEFEPPKSAANEAIAKPSAIVEVKGKDSKLIYPIRIYRSRPGSKTMGIMRLRSGEYQDLDIVSVIGLKRDEVSITFSKENVVRVETALQKFERTELGGKPADETTAESYKNGVSQIITPVSHGKVEVTINIRNGDAIFRYDLTVE